jgi:hypothetical protein
LNATAACVSFKLVTSSVDDKVVLNYGYLSYKAFYKSSVWLLPPKFILLVKGNYHCASKTGTICVELCDEFIIRPDLGFPVLIYEL